MAIRVALNHVTHYTYDRPVTLSPHVVRLRPAPHCRTPITGYSLRITPGEHFLNWQQDPFGNYQARLVFHKPTARAEGRGRPGRRPDHHQPVRLLPRRIRRAASRSPTSRRCARSWRRTWRWCRRAQRLDLFTERVRGQIARSGPAHGRRAGRHQPARPAQRCATTSAWSRACSRPRRRWSAATARAATSPGCWCSVLRQLGFAARFVSGYSIQLVADQKPLEGPAGVDRGRHRSARLGRGVPARRRLGGPGRHQRPDVRRGPHPAGLHARARQRRARSPAASPGTKRDERRRSSARSSTFTMTVTRLDDPPRPTKPYDDAHLARHPGLRRRRSTRALERQDVRLTMGGEPTFVSIDDMDGRRVEHRRAGPDQGAPGRPAAAAAGPRASRPGGAAAPRAGQVVPGRAAAPLGLLLLLPQGRRADLARSRRCSPQPGDGARTASERGGARVHPGAGRAGWRWMPTFAHARATRTSSTTCGASGGCRSTSIRSTPSSKTSRSARACAGCSSRGWRSVVGFALPLRAADRPERRASRWQSGPLVPARRAPVPAARRFADGLPPAARFAALGGAEATARQRDPSAIRWRRARPLPPRQQLRRHAAARRRAGRRSAIDGRRPPRGQSAAGVVRTALCVEPRGGHPARVHAAGARARGVPRRWSPRIEDTAAELGQPVRLEGYQPPSRPPRCSGSRSRPIPGVIEVNIHPAALLARAGGQHHHPLRGGARSCRLGTEKFMLDGRHTGTGGGNHVVLGGATPADSPLLRRPDLLRSLARLLAEPPVAVVPVLGPVHRPHQPGAARGRGPPRLALRAGDRASRSLAPARRPRRRPGWSIACSATCWSTSPATPTAPSCASTSCTARTAPAAARACSSCAPSRCRPTRA